MSSFIIFSTVILVSKYYAVVVRHWFSNIYFCVSLQKMSSYSVSIRAIETEKYQVIDKRRNEILEEIEESKAFFQVVTLNSLLSNFCCKPTQYFAYQSASNFLKYLLRFFFPSIQVYDGAVYIHQGRTYLVQSLDLSSMITFCEEADLKYYTRPRDCTDIHVISGDIVCHVL